MAGAAVSSILSGAGVATPTTVAAHGPYEDLAIEGIRLIEKLIDGMTAEQKAKVWQNWIDFWQPLLDAAKKAGI